MVTEAKKKIVVKVICPHGDLCGNPGCMHFSPHEPVFHGDKPYQNCREEITICPLVGATVKCQCQ